MTRFDAAEATDRRKLYVDAITAHRERGRGFLTLEADATDLEGDSDDAESPDSALGAPWIQFADGTINVDCTDDELDALKSVLGEFPAFKIDEINRPEDAEGANVRVSAKADPNRIAQCLDAIFQRVYELPEDVRVWVVDL
ncbi:hypothetical protein C477_12868 [Haloterrigena salina JCM 13891]|uniref:DUF7975 domain-containing protein n=1 Tax=Haloterrigena salina JCM 13891 TaxID=1227488 RepID=M0C256_9EURY|nr:hypothetical protein [Haloterrigena salina]ELZ17371.1 hypothetical protein C477_12868 [Haloterrigena salina JCM 13891]